MDSEGHEREGKEQRPEGLEPPAVLEDGPHLFFEGEVIGAEREASELDRGSHHEPDQGSQNDEPALA